MRKIFLFVALHGVFYLSIAQNVNKVFRNVKWSEQFKSVQGVWSQTTSAQNVFLQDPEGYNVWRKNESNGFVLLPNNNSTFDFFQVELAFEFDKSEGKKQYAGLVLQAQEGGTGAIMVELNRKRQFRIRRAANSRITNISEGKDGWIKNSKIKGKTEFVLKVVTKDRLYDIYVNDVFIHTFTEIEFTEGKIGLYIGEGSRAIFKSLVVKSDEEEDIFTTTTNKTQDQILTETIVKLRETINKKDQKIASLEADLRGFKNTPEEDTTTQKELDRLRSENRKNSDLIDDLETENETLSAQVKKLQLFKNEITNNENGDIIVNLSNLTTTQKLKIAEQENTIRLQNENIESLKNDKRSDARIISVLELNNLRCEEQAAAYEQQIKAKDSTNIELNFRVKELEETVKKLEKEQGKSSGKSDRKKKRKDKKKEELPEFIIEE